MTTISVTLPADGDTIDASDVNNPINTIVNVINGGLDSTNVSAGGLTPANLTSGTGTSWAWQSWTPTYDDITVGSGTAVAKYIQIGKTVHWRYHFTFGSGSSVGSAPTLTLPVNCITTDLDNSFIGTGRMIDANSTDFIAYSIKSINAQHTQPVYDAGDGTVGAVSSTAPFTWATGDEIILSGTYEAA